MRSFILIISFLLSPLINSYPQLRYFTTSGYAHFFSKAPLENIEATSNEVKAVIDFSNGELLFIVPVKTFVFEKDLMQRHFNDNFLETQKFPEARLVGRIIDFNPIISYYSEPRQIIVKGNLTIHGVTKEITEIANLRTDQSSLQGETTFIVSLEDYDIKIPSILLRNIAEKVEVSIKVTLEKNN